MKITPDGQRLEKDLFMQVSYSPIYYLQREVMKKWIYGYIDISIHMYKYRYIHVVIVYLDLLVIGYIQPQITQLHTPDDF